MLGGYVLLCILLGTWLVWTQRARQSPRQKSIEAAPLPAGLELWSGNQEYVVDPIVGHRCRPDCTIRFFMAPLGGSPVFCTRTYDGQGFVRLHAESDEARGDWTSPRILAVGDSHLTGVVSTEKNATTLLEARLRNRTSTKSATVLNASAGFYSLHQLVLRARSLRETLRPDWIVLVVFMGNDFVELEDVGRPHLDDDGDERPAVVPAPAETTSPRRNWLGLAEEGPFWQGLNQATFFFQHPESQPVIERKSTRAIELAKAEAMACGARLLVVMLPSFDVVFPERARELSVHAAEVVDSGVAVRWHQGFAETLDRLEVEAIDLLPAFRETGDPSVYATDGHIFERGHLLLAAQLFDRLSAELRH